MLGANLRPKASTNTMYVLLFTNGGGWIAKKLVIGELQRHFLAYAEYIEYWSIKNILLWVGAMAYKSAPTNLQPRLQIPNTPSYMLLSIFIVEIGNVFVIRLIRGRVYTKRDQGWAKLKNILLLMLQKPTKDFNVVWWTTTSGHSAQDLKSQLLPTDSETIVGKILPLWQSIECI